MFTTGQNVYLLCKNGASLMPAIYVGETETGLSEVASRTGVVYDCQSENVFSDEDGAQMLRQRRAEQLTQEGYEIRFTASGKVRMFQPRKHGVDGGYILTPNADGDYACDCPSAIKTGEYCCKHSLGVHGMILAQQTAAATVEAPRPPVGTARVECSADELDRKIEMRRLAKLAAAA